MKNKTGQRIHLILLHIIRPKRSKILTEYELHDILQCHGYDRLLRE